MAKSCAVHESVAWRSIPASASATLAQSHTCQVGLPHRLWHTFELLGDRFLDEVEDVGVPPSCSWAIAAVDLCLERFRWADAVCAMELHRGQLADADHLRWARVVLRNYRSSRSVSCHHRREHTSTFQPSTAHQRHGRRGQTSYRALLWDCMETLRAVAQVSQTTNFSLFARYSSSHRLIARHVPHFPQKLSTTTVLFESPLKKNLHTSDLTGTAFMPERVPNWHVYPHFLVQIQHPPGMPASTIAGRRHVDPQEKVATAIR